MKNQIISISLLLCVSFVLSQYSRKEAVAYARKWAKGANHKCGKHTSCTPASYWGS